MEKKSQVVAQRRARDAHRRARGRGAGTHRSPERGGSLTSASLSLSGICVRRHFKTLVLGRSVFCSSITLTEFCSSPHWGLRYALAMAAAARATHRPHARTRVVQLRTREAGRRACRSSSKSASLELPKASDLVSSGSGGPSRADYVRRWRRSQASSLPLGFGEAMAGADRAIPRVQLHAGLHGDDTNCHRRRGAMQGSEWLVDGTSQRSWRSAAPACSRSRRHLRRLWLAARSSWAPTGSGVSRPKWSSRHDPRTVTEDGLESRTQRYCCLSL